MRIRSRLGVAALLVVTGGFYYLVWYYRVNRELRDYGRAFGPPNPLAVDLTRTLLAVTLAGVVVVPAAVSVARTFERILRAERLSGAARTLSSRVGLVLFVAALVLFLVVLAPIGELLQLVISVAALALLAGKLAYTQHHVNEIWRRELARAT